jgi:hypothetical protein
MESIWGSKKDTLGRENNLRGGFQAGGLKSHASLFNSFHVEDPEYLVLKVKHVCSPRLRRVSSLVGNAMRPFPTVKVPMAPPKYLKMLSVRAC